jgi:hypothetical protein
VEQRPKATEIDPALITKLILKAPVADKAEEKCLAPKLIWTIRHYRARVLADKQERPARIAAALKPGLKPARDLLRWLNSLPPGLRFELQAGGMEELLEALISKTKHRLAYWQRHVETHRPSGKGAASLDLRRSLIDIIAAHSSADERKQRNWVAFACGEIGARYPLEKKNRQRFTGAG